MRPAGKGELESLYFDYPRFYAPGREAVEARPRHQVAIVGAGPVGMAAALALARFGVPSVLFDDKPTFNDGSRAICLQRSSLQILERLGAVEPFLAKALGWTMGRSFYRGRQILEFEMAHDENEKYLPMYNLQQQYIERYLWDAIDRSDLIEQRWCSKVVGLEDDADGAVRISIEDPNGSYDCHADWVLAADGSRSRLRGMRGLRLNGSNFEGKYVIADVKMEHDYPTIRRALFDSASNPDKTILIHRQPDDIWRIDYQLPDDEDPDDAIREENIRRNVATILADIGHAGPWELEWWSIYSANTLALDDYRDGRVFFIGDAAHIVPIFGVRGLNNGLADAENIGWKLARVLSGQSDEGLLDSYTPERRGATLDAFHNSTKSAKFMTPPSPGWRLMRDAALSLALDHDFASDFANPRQMEPFHYGDIGAVAAGDPQPAGVPAVGTLAPEVKLGNGGYLSDLFGNSFSALALSGEVDGALMDRMRTMDPAFEIVSAASIEERFGKTAAARVAARYGEAPGMFLIRPDGYLAGYWRDGDAARIATAVADVFGTG